MDLFVVLIYAFLFSVILASLYFRFRAQVNQIPGPEIDSILYGNIKHLIRPANVPRDSFIKNFYKTYAKFFDKYRTCGIFKLWLGPFHAAYYLTNAANVEILLKSRVNLNKSIVYDLFSSFLKDGLLTAKTENWKQLRKLFNPAFNSKMSKHFIPSFTRYSNELISSINAKFESSIEDKIFIDDIRPLFEGCTLDIIKETAMGVIDQTDLPSNEMYRERINKFLNDSMNRIKNVFFWSDMIFKSSKKGKQFFENIWILQNYSEKIITNRISNEAKIPDKNILIDLLLENFVTSNTEKNGQNIQSILTHVNTFVLGGYATTATTLTFAVLMVGQHPKIQDKIYDELCSIFQGDMSREINFDDLCQMQYLELCIKETLRLYPPIQIIGRKLTEPLVLTDGKILPSNSNCYAPIYFLHRDPNYFPKPEEFIPERFLHNQKFSNAYAYIPFSAGTRNCIGQKYAMIELKCILATLFRHYRVEARTKTEDLVLQLNPMMKPLTKIAISFEKVK